MKYMGSKRSMLSNGLGKILTAELATASRFADLFVGSGAVAWFAAETSARPVLAADLQLFATVLADAVISRDKPVDPVPLWDDWSRRAKQKAQKDKAYDEAQKFAECNWMRARRRNVEIAREISATSSGTVTRAYGGHYFSPSQALTLDALRGTLPEQEAERSVALGALVTAASECAAAPGHTAQPFQPTANAASFLFESWRRDVDTYVAAALKRISLKHAQQRGKTFVSDAETMTDQLKQGDLAFVDPPYSGVHYSRFYHVLETVARGQSGGAEGAGRYPPTPERPKSEFSIKSKSSAALDRLLTKLASHGVRAVLTFPQEETSNGLSGEKVEAIANNYFTIEKAVTNGRFSTLGGNLKNRKARIPAYEIILTLTPRVCT